MRKCTFRKERLPCLALPCRRPTQRCSFQAYWVEGEAGATLPGVLGAPALPGVVVLVAAAMTGPRGIVTASTTCKEIKERARQGENRIELGWVVSLFRMTRHDVPVRSWRKLCTLGSWPLQRSCISAVSPYYQHTPTHCTYLVLERVIHLLWQSPPQCMNGVNDGYHLAEHAHTQVAAGAHAHGRLGGGQLQLVSRACGACAAAADTAVVPPAAESEAFATDGAVRHVRLPHARRGDAEGRAAATDGAANPHNAWVLLCGRAAACSTSTTTAAAVVCPCPSPRAC